MVLTLLLIGLAITLEPFPLTAFILVLSAEKGIWKGLAYILGWLGCLVVVIASVIAATQNNPPKPHTSPSDAALAIKLVIGVVLVALAIRKRRQMGRPRKPAAWMARLDRLSLLGAAGLAAFLQPWTLVAAGAATILEAKLSSPDSYVALIFFCLLATSSFLYLEVYATFGGGKAEARLGRLRKWLDSHQDQVVIGVFLLLGLWLTGNSIYLLVS
ncbi:MAG TPA: GAP family protein [Streptosporangiaceae bacterium]|nr:GAP family protein [Streptosporangiaceae bacterium]